MSSNEHAEMIAAALLRLRVGGRQLHREPHHHDQHHGHHDHHHDAQPHGHNQNQGAHYRGKRGGGPAQARMLIELRSADQSLSVTELAERIGVDQPRASRLTAQSVQQGLVQREADPEDARRTRIALTEEGHSIADRMLASRSSRVEAALASFSEADKATLAHLLTQLAEAWRP